MLLMNVRIASQYLDKLFKKYIITIVYFLDWILLDNSSL